MGKLLIVFKNKGEVVTDGVDSLETPGNYVIGKGAKVTVIIIPGGSIDYCKLTKEE